MTVLVAFRVRIPEFALDQHTNSDKDVNNPLLYDFSQKSNRWSKEQTSTLQSTLRR